MKYLLTRFPWIYPVSQYAGMLCLFALVMMNISQAHYLQMAFDSFLLGMLFWGFAIGKMMERRMKEINDLAQRMSAAELRAVDAACRFEKALVDGYIEAMPTSFDEIEPKPPTRH